MKSKAKYRLLALLILCITLPSTGAADSVLRVANFYNAKQSVSEKVLEQAYKRLNIKINIVYMPAARTLWVANKGAVDGEVARLAGLDKIYSNLLMVKIPIAVISPSVYTREGTYFTVNGWQSLKPYRIAYLRGVKVVENNLQGLSAEGVATIAQAFMMLDHNRVDVVIADTHQAADSLPKFPHIKRLSPAVYSFPVYHYLHKKHADLVPKLEAVLQQMIADKTIEGISRD